MGTAMGGLQMIETLKAAGMEDEFFARWAGYQAKVVDAEQKLGVQTQFLGRRPRVRHAGQRADRAHVGRLAHHGRQPHRRHAGRLPGAGRQLHRAAHHPGHLRRHAAGAAGDMNRLDDVLALPRPSDDAVPPRAAAGPAAPPQARSCAGKVELRGVTFGYSPLDAAADRGLQPDDRARPARRAGRRLAAAASRPSPSSSRASTSRGRARSSSTACRGTEIPRELMVNSSRRRRPGHLPVRRHDRGERDDVGHDAARRRACCAPPRTRRSRGASRRARRPTTPASQEGGAQLQRRPAPAPGDRAGAGRRPDDPHPRRGDERARPGHRGA